VCCIQASAAYPTTAVGSFWPGLVDPGAPVETQSGSRVLKHSPEVGGLCFYLHFYYTWGVKLFA
jgi:hypothetical protein